MIVHHLGRSQSERIVWLCEELGLGYELRHHVRDAQTMLSPPSLLAVHPTGAAPVIEDAQGDNPVVLAESGAILAWILAKYGRGRLELAPDHADYAAYLYWLHYANGTLQPAMGRGMIIRRLALPEDNPVRIAMLGRLAKALGLLEARLAGVLWLAGAEFTAADIMTVFSVTTMRYFNPTDLGGCPAILAYLQRVAARPAYQRAMAKGDPGMALLLT